ncbi:MAG: PilZ domain-containing protein [Deltaproteobacteria bacterium]|nr:PilZ domain-containing protein [Deltaproteobacteria bacterium]
MTEERRKNPRIELRFKITINIRHKGIHEVKDLSVGGLFIRATDPSLFREGDEIELVIQLPVENSPTILNARVCHAGENGIGVEFFDVKPEDQKALEYCFSLAFLVSPFPYLIEKGQAAGMGSEKRRNPRIDIHLPVEMTMQQEEPQMVKDLSVGGLFIETTNPSEFRVGDKIELVMREPADSRLMRLNAQVAHVGKNGIGVEFFNVTAEDQKALKTCFDLFRYTWPKIDS